MTTIGERTINFTELYDNLNHINDLNYVANYLSDFLDEPFYAAYDVTDESTLTNIRFVQENYVHAYDGYYTFTFTVLVNEPGIDFGFEVTALNVVTLDESVVGGTIDVEGLDFIFRRAINRPNESSGLDADNDDWSDDDDSSDDDSSDDDSSDDDFIPAPAIPQREQENSLYFDWYTTSVNTDLSQDYQAWDNEQTRIANTQNQNFDEFNIIRRTPEPDDSDDDELGLEENTTIYNIRRIL